MRAPCYGAVRAVRSQRARGRRDPTRARARVLPAMWKRTATAHVTEKTSQCPLPVLDATGGTLSGRAHHARSGPRAHRPGDRGRPLLPELSITTSAFASRSSRLAWRAMRARASASLKPTVLDQALDGEVGVDVDHDRGGRVVALPLDQEGDVEDDDPVRVGQRGELLGHRTPTAGCTIPFRVFSFSSSPKTRSATAWRSRVPSAATMPGRTPRPWPRRPARPAAAAPGRPGRRR